MTIKSTSYGSTTNVAARTPRYAGTGGVFTTTTRPTLLQIEMFIDEVSGLVNSILAQNGFITPISQSIVLDMLGMFVEDEVASIAEGINGSGRFGPTTNNPTGSRFKIIMTDVQTFVEMNAAGMEKLGSLRDAPPSLSIGYRDTSEAGNPTFPLFQRDTFGQDGFFEDTGDVDGR